MKKLVNLGSGPLTIGLPRMFDDWTKIRVDIDRASDPDILANLTDRLPLEDSSVDAVWASHCIEHVYAHEVGQVLIEAHRILADDGFLVAIVPDLQAIAQYMAEDRLDDVVYRSASGPVSAHDMIWGFGPALARGHLAMAHKCGFTASRLSKTLQSSPFPAGSVIRRVAHLELVAIGWKVHRHHSDVVNLVRDLNF